MIFQCVLLICGVSLALYISYSAGLWRFNYIDSKNYFMHGLDVSHHQGIIQWDRIEKDRFQFVYIKATEGGDYKDQAFSRNWHEAQRNGLKAGAYHFFTLCRSGKDQAKNFLAQAKKQTGFFESLPPALDLEFTGNCSKRPLPKELLAQIDDFVSEVKNQTGQDMIFYTTYAFYERYLKNSPYQIYPIWIRDIFSKPHGDLSNIWVIWQYADNARIPGIEGPVDLNVTRRGF